MPGPNNTAVLIKALDSGGDIPVKIDLWKGSYEVRLAFSSPAAADARAAAASTLRQLAQLPGS